MNSRPAQIALNIAIMRLATLSQAERAELVVGMVDKIITDLVKQYDADPRLERQFGSLPAFLSQCHDELTDQMARARAALPVLQ